MEMRVCQRCNVSYEFVRGERGGYKFCSSECADPYVPRPRRVLRCAVCAEPFEAQTSSHKYCSEVCAQRRRSGESSALRALRTCARCGEAFQTRGRAKYCSQACRCEVEGIGKNDAEYARWQLGDRCQDCGASREDAGAPLHLHHVLPRGFGGSDHLSNLRLLCPDCHQGSGWVRNHVLIAEFGVQPVSRVAHEAA